MPADGRLAYTQSEIHHYDQVLDHYDIRYEQRSEQYISGYTTTTEYIDLGNGYFDTETRTVPEYSTRYYTEEVKVPVYRDEPVYRTKYYYDVDRWVYERTARASGVSNTPYSLEEESFPGENSAVPFWPTFELGNLEREGSHSATYKIYGIVTSDKKQPKKSYKVSYDFWVTLHPGDTIKATVSFGKVSDFKKVE